MLREEIKRLRQATPGELRKFGLMVGGVFVVLSMFFLWRHKSWYWWLLVPGIPLVVLGLIAPRTLKWVNVVWMTLAIMLGTAVSTILLSLLFYLVVTPIGLLARTTGQDFLSRKLEASAVTYWIRRDVSKRKPPHKHEQQF
jgi:hypothetical protein